MLLSAAKVEFTRQSLTAYTTNEYAVINEGTTRNIMLSSTSHNKCSLTIAITATAVIVTLA